MDIIVPIVILILLFITCSVCGYCCKRNKQGVVYGTTHPVTTTTTTNYQATPYPVMETPMPQPGAVAAPVGFAPHAAYPPTTPYPPTGNPPYPTSGGFPGAAPYPTMPTMPMPGAYTSPVPAYPANSAVNQLPPSYAEATQNAARTVNTVNEGYVQQAPYNPHYN